jgi:hypothetical protein
MGLAFMKDSVEQLQNGALVRVRSRQYLVRSVKAIGRGADRYRRVSLACVEDDAEGEELEVIWEHELDARVSKLDFEQLGQRGFDPADRFAAYVHALRWNAVSAGDSEIIQSPWRAGIEVLTYQLEPLQRALELPRVNLFIADDVGLGKTIEAGLVLRELIMRQRVRRVVVAAPASVVPQWRDELEERFGLTFVVYDRDYARRMRMERGYTVNPFSTHSRFIVSHALLHDEEYAAPLREWLGEFADGSMLILDEAHHAAPASGSKWAVDSKFTRAVRDIARRFEHRIFLSATPHNGLTNSFTALLEILDPQRFVRGTSVDETLRDQVMVRRLKMDLAADVDGIPERVVESVLIDAPKDAPELRLATLLDRYIDLHAEALAAGSGAANARRLALVTLRKRLLSSVAAFRQTLRAHRKSIGEHLGDLDRNQKSSPETDGQGELYDDAVPDRDEEAVADISNATDAEVVAAGSAFEKPSEEAHALLEQMSAVADKASNSVDARLTWIFDWLDNNICINGNWQPRRVIFFTEYSTTQRWLVRQLQQRYDENNDGRIESLHGATGTKDRERIKWEFNAKPSASNLPVNVKSEESNLRILVCTDAAREGLNLQNHCADLFHMDLPWNPSRIEQRNGRIDRKLQKSPKVYCRHFVYTARPFDRVLEVVAERTRIIRSELGVVPPVLDETFLRILGAHLTAGSFANAENALRNAFDEAARSSITTDLESARLRQREKVKARLVSLREMHDRSASRLALNSERLRSVLDASLLMLGASPLTPHPSEPGLWDVPDLVAQLGRSWMDVMDALRPSLSDGTRPERADKLAEWRRTSLPRPVVFQDPGRIDTSVVHLHLEHRLVRRLLQPFVAQGFAADHLCRACLGSSIEKIPRVVLLGRVSLFGDAGARLHDELVWTAADWVEPSLRTGQLSPLPREVATSSYDALHEALGRDGHTHVAEGRRKALLDSTARDVAELEPHLQAIANQVISNADRRLDERGKLEGERMTEILKSQEKRIRTEILKLDSEVNNAQLLLGFNPEEIEQRKRDRVYWEARLEQIPRELKEQPAAVRQSYAVVAKRYEPVGIAYLWPQAG